MSKKKQKKPAFNKTYDPEVEPVNEAPIPNPPEPVKRNIGPDIRALSISVREMADLGFETLYDNLEELAGMYPERKQFELALKCKKSGDIIIARQALRNGVVDLE